MTAHSMSSAPTPLPTDPTTPDSEEEAARYTEEFLASLAYEATADDDNGYVSPDGTTVHVTANMMGDDDLLLMTPAQAAYPTQGSAPQSTSLSEKDEHQQGHGPTPPPTPAELEAHFLQLERDRITAHVQNPRPFVPTSNEIPQLASGVSILKLLPPTGNNPKAEITPTYLEAFESELRTIAQIDVHEARIYQAGYTPKAIRSKIKLLLRNLKPEEHLVDFQTLHIPPETRDPQTHMVLHALLRELKKTKDAMSLSLLQDHNMNAEYVELGREHNITNRVMHQIYSDSPFIIRTTTSCFIANNTCATYLHKLLLNYILSA